MPFTKGQRVKLLANKYLGGQVVSAGSKGTVTQDAPTADASWVQFDNSALGLIPNVDLAPTT